MFHMTFETCKGIAYVAASASLLWRVAYAHTSTMSSTECGGTRSSVFDEGDKVACIAARRGTGLPLVKVE